MRKISNPESHFVSGVVEWWGDFRHLEYQLKKILITMGINFKDTTGRPLNYLAEGIQSLTVERSIIKNLSIVWDCQNYFVT